MTLCLRVTERLLELHSKGIVHRDLKTDNVTVQFDAEGELDSVHLIDFGLARRVGNQKQDKVRDLDRNNGCSCIFSDERLRLECDLMGLATIFEDLFENISDVPDYMFSLLNSCSTPSHDARPALEYIRQCFESECSRLSAAPLGDVKPAAGKREAPEEDCEEEESAPAAKRLRRDSN